MTKIKCEKCKYFVPSLEGFGRCNVKFPMWVNRNKYSSDNVVAIYTDCSRCKSYECKTEELTEDKNVQ